MSNIERNIVIAASAPGKVILSGEHSVVYGCPALAMAVDRFATTTITEQQGCGVWFEFLNDGLKHVTTMHELQALKIEISKRYRKFTVGKCQIKDVVRSPLELIQYAFIYLVENLFLEIKGGLKIQVEITLPMGCGMGASAAVISSLIHALAEYCGHTLTVDKCLYFGREIENLQHGRSSGLDLFLSLHGGCYFFVAGDAAVRNLPDFPFILVNTGKAKSSTGECVEKVANKLQNADFAESFTQATLGIDKALQKNDLAMFQMGVQQNNILLNELGVVPGKVAEFISAVEARGNAAKVSGAGAVYGDSAGIVLVIGDKDIFDIVKQFGYETLLVNGEHSGVSLV